MAVMRFVLLPFAIGLSLDVAVAGNQIAGRRAGAVSGALTLLAALGFWYGHFARKRRQKQHQPAEDQMEDTPLDQRIVEVLTENRILLPGAQALIGFQLAMVLMEPFSQLPREARLVHLASLGFITLATIVLMAPAAYHRIVERGRDTERFHAFASRMLILALALLGPGFAAEIFVVLQRAGYPRAALPIACATVAVFYAAWFGAMLLLRRRTGHDQQDRTSRGKDLPRDLAERRSGTAAP